METQLLLSLAIALVITINSDFGRIYDFLSKKLFNGKTNICRY